MSSAAEFPAQQTIIGEHLSARTVHELALIQGDTIISTFPENQTDAAINLARVLCRALAQPVDLFRKRCRAAEAIEAGVRACPTAPGWTHVAHLHFADLKGVDVVMCDPGRRVTVADQHSTP